MATLESLGLTNPSTLTGLALGVVASYAVGGPAKGSLVRAAVFGAIGAAAGRMLIPQRPLTPQERLALAEQNAEQARQEAIINRQEAARRRTTAAQKAAMAPAVAVQRARAKRQLRQAEEQLERTSDILRTQSEAAEAEADMVRDAEELEARETAGFQYVGQIYF